MTDDVDFTEFTESGYVRLLELGRARFRFERFGTASNEPHVLWRHDVDVSVHRAARLAELESERGVIATYFFWFHSPFYNLLEKAVTELVRRVVHVHGHALGLHFDSGYFGMINADETAARVRDEAALLSELAGAPVEAFSFHNPQVVNDDLAVDVEDVGGVLNVYGRRIRERYTYVSDANGYWRHRSAFDALGDADEERLHVLTHPEWWQTEPMAPRARVLRSVEGRARRVLSEYDELLARHGRRNIA